MDVVAIYDYYFLEDPYRRFDDRCEYGLCDKSVVHRRLRCAVEEHKRREKATTAAGEGGLCDVLEYMLYNVSGDTGLSAHYSCCMYLYRATGRDGSNDSNGDDDDETTSIEYVESGHVCNAIPIMIGSRLERKVITRLAETLGVRVSDLYDAEYLHTVYAGSFLVNGTFYYSVFRESNNNKVCHNSKSKYRGDETVAYFYDNACNRGVKVFTNSLGQLRVNDRDGNEVTDVTPDVVLQLYKECLHDWRHYTLDMRLVEGFFSAVKRQGLTGIDNFKNKIYTNYSVGLNTFLDKLPSSAITSNPMWNASLMVGKINLGISQRLNYPKSKAETKKQNEQKLQMCGGGKSTRYLIEAQRRRNNVRKTAATAVNTRHDVITRCSTDTVEKKRKRAVVDTCTENPPKKKHTTPLPAATGVVTERTILGTKDVKTGGLMERLEQGERNGPSTFNQVAVSYLPLIGALSSTVQKLQVEHVHAESSKTVPRDAYGFICMKYMGNISTAGKNMLFTEKVQVAYGHMHKAVAAVENGLRVLAKERRWVRKTAAAEQDDDAGHWLYVVINNAVTVWSVSRTRLIHLLVYIKTRCHRFAWTKVVGDYLCVYYYEGVPLLRYERGDMMFEALSHMIAVDGGDDGASDDVGDITSLYFSRDELEMLAATTTSGNGGGGFGDLVARTNRLIDYWLSRRRADGRGYDGVELSSTLAKHVDQYTDYTPPAKRSVSVNARKSACVNVYYQRAADLIRGFNIFVDPDGYERSTAERVATDHGIPEWVTLRDFARVRGELENCPGNRPGRGGGARDRSLDNFYVLRTIFADIDGHNVEDANVLDESVDLNLSYSYSFSLTFVDRSEKGLDIVVPRPRDAASVCCWDSRGNPTGVLFAVCTIRKREGERINSAAVAEMLNVAGGADGRKDRGDTRRGQRQAAPPTTEDDTTSFPPFRKLSVLRSADGDYHVYFVRNDAVLLRSVRKLRERAGGPPPVRPDASNSVRLAEDAFAFAFDCTPEVNAYDALTSLRTRVTGFDTKNKNDGNTERVITVDVRVHGRSDKYDGVKVVNSFGQKGLALIKDVRPYFDTSSPASHNVPVQLVMNNCSFVSRQPIGQLLQMRKNMHAVTTSAAGEATSVGHTAVFIIETEPSTKTCPVRLDEMVRSVLITSNMTVFQNLKSSLDNVYNPHGVLYPPQAEQILGLYRCVGVSYKFSGDGGGGGCGSDRRPFSSAEDVDYLLRLYEKYTRMPRPGKTNDSQTLLRLADLLQGDETRKRRLLDAGMLQERRSDDEKKNFYVLCSDGKRRQRRQRRQRPDFEIRTYDSASDAYRTVYVFGDPVSVLMEAEEEDEEHTNI